MNYGKCWNMFLQNLDIPLSGRQILWRYQAEHFAVLCRMEASTRELPAFFEMTGNIEKKWARYLSYGLLLVFGAAYLFSCIFTLQMEEALSEARRQRYVRM
jgi:hypothetical protein